jgi:AcrR family transcriptional regulator
MEGVAHNAGVSRLLIYRIFETKQRLYRAVLSSVTDEFVAEFQDRDMADVRRRGGIVRVMLGIARRHPDAFRLLWRQAAQEPAFAEFARVFRRVISQHAVAMITLDGRITDPQTMQWCATTLGAHLLDGMCVWLDDGDASRDDEYTVLQVCSLFAMLNAWGDPHPPDWVTAPPPGHP